MRQRLALIAIKQNDVAGRGLLLAQLQTQTDPIDLAGDLPPFQCAPRPPVTELFFRNALDSCERLMRTPSRVSISARRRAIVQFGRLATGSSSNGVTTRKAVSLFTGDGPGATLAFKVSMPPRLKSLRHSRTVLSRTLNASAMRGLSNLKASAGWRVLYPPRRDHVSQPEPLKPSVGPRSPKQETCRSCHALTN